MSWSIGYDYNWKRDIGYGVPAWCDHPGCGGVIDRGLSYVCGEEPYGGDKGCGLYFCPEHLGYNSKATVKLCGRCLRGKPPFPKKTDHPDWMAHKATDESWAQWRQENPEEVASMQSSTPNRRREIVYESHIVFSLDDVCYSISFLDQLP